MITIICHPLSVFHIEFFAEFARKKHRTNRLLHLPLVENISYATLNTFMS